MLSNTFTGNRIIFRIKNSHVRLTTFIMLALLLFLSSCTEIKLQSLEANKCEKCKEYLDNHVRLKSNALSTKWMKTLGNLRSIDGIDWDKLFKKKFRNKREIYAVDFSSYNKFKENIHCLIGLKLSTIKSLMPRKTITRRYSNISSTEYSFRFETFKKEGKYELVWTGTKSVRLIFKTIGHQCIFVGTEKQQEWHEECTNNSQ